MADFTVHPDSVNVEHIMEQIRARISEKRGTEYTDEQIRGLAAVKLEAFLDPQVVRTEVLQQFQQLRSGQRRVTPEPFKPGALFETHRSLVATFRRLLNPILRLFFNPDPVSKALQRVNDLDARIDTQLEMQYTLIHSLVIELTRTGIEVTNLKMRVESLSSRLEFNERRARALERAMAENTAAPRAASSASYGSQVSQTSQASNQGRRSDHPGGSRPQGPRYPPSAQRPPSAGSRSDPPPAEAATVDTPIAEVSATTPHAEHAPGTVPSPTTTGPSQEGGVPRSRRRRRRRGRRGGGTGPGGGPLTPGANVDSTQSGGATDEADGGHAGMAATPNGPESAPGGSAGEPESEASLDFDDDPSGPDSGSEP